MALSPPPQSQAQLRLAYIDRPEILETYVDSLWRVYFDGQTIRMDFAVHRMDDPQPQVPPTGKAFIAARIVMPVAAMVNMLNKLQDVVAQLQAQGTIRHVHAPAGTQIPH